MRKTIHLNFNWEFASKFTSDFSKGYPCDTVEVDLPHTCRETPFHYFDESIYQMICGYRKRITLPKKSRGKRVFLIVGAAGHSAQVYINGEPCSEPHIGGYTEFTVDLTDRLKEGDETWLSIKVDSRESQNIPPFGNVVDYMTYGGLYREVRLEIREQKHIKDLFVRPCIPEENALLSGNTDPESISFLEFEGVIETDLSVSEGNCSIRQSVYNSDDADDKKPIVTAEFSRGEKLTLDMPGAHLWDTENPKLYRLKTELIDGGSVTDRIETIFGFRRAVFKKDGFYLNGRKLKLIGLNRHQSFPYVGYAMPASIQRNDADILKRELGLNAVRTSHYPQSHHFIGRCDELGLLVFTEIPGWQHIGNDEWKNAAVRMTAEMVTQYRNHPSIVLWGVRINESPDDDEFYKRTNETARSLDPTRQTGGVKCNKRSSLLEDVYTYNDFIHDGVRPGCEPKSAVTSDKDKPYLISEYCGHMYPTKTFDSEEHRLEHVLRHTRILNAVSQQEDIAGSFGWCFFDYNTHKDFGSGDRICYHGVCDMFRNPKLAASVYSVNQDKEPVLNVSSSMDIGEHPASVRGRIYVFTNADSIRFYKNDLFIREYTHSSKEFPYLKRSPIEIDDLVGEQISENESFKPKQAQYVMDILNEAARFGISRLSTRSKLKAAWLMLFYRMTFSDAYALYGKYIENWGAKAVSYRFEAVKNGKIVKTVSLSPFETLHLKAVADHTVLKEKETYDAAAIRITMTDQNGNVLPFYNGAVKLDTEGDIRIIGPKEAMLFGGMGGTYIRSLGKSGKATVTLSAESAESVRIEFMIHTERNDENA